jgi:AraC-like DNA-binding protein
VRSAHPQAQKIRNWILLLLIPFTLLLFILFFGPILSLFTTIDTYFSSMGIRSLLLIFIFSRVLLNSDLLFGLPDIETRVPFISFLKQNSESLVAITEQVQHAVTEPNKMDEPSPPRREQPTADDISYDEFGWVRTQQMPDPASPGTGAPRIEKDRVITYVAKINGYLKTEPYTDPDFSMQHMSSSLGIPVHHLEYLFRYYNKNSFVEFRNILRVRYTLLCLEQDLLKQYTLEAIGEKAGFASRTTLFRVFKQVTGKSPKAYLDTMQQTTPDS